MVRPSERERDFRLEWLGGPGGRIGYEREVATFAEAVAHFEERGMTLREEAVAIHSDLAAALLKRVLEFKADVGTYRMRGGLWWLSYPIAAGVSVREAHEGEVEAAWSAIVATAMEECR